MVETKALDADFQALANSYSLDVLAAKVLSVEQEINGLKICQTGIPISLLNSRRASLLSGPVATPRSRIPVVKSRLIISRSAGTLTGSGQ